MIQFFDLTFERIVSINNELCGQFEQLHLPNSLSNNSLEFGLSVGQIPSEYAEMHLYWHIEPRDI